MTFFVPDISHHQAGIDIHALKMQGSAALIARVGQGAGRRTNGQGYGTTRDREWVRHRDEARRVGLPLIAYWYVGDQISADDNAALAEAWVGDKTIPWMIDHEDASGSLAFYCQVVTAFKRRGLRVILGYVPRWYWENQGRGDLSCGPPLVNSRYVSSLSASPAAIYANSGGDTATAWIDFGGQDVLFWQFTNKAQMAGRPIDCSAFRGNLNELLTLINGTPEVEAMRNLVLARQPSTGLVTAGDGITRRHVASEADLADLHYTAHRLGITLLDAGDIENLDGVMGADIAAVLAGLADDEAAIIAAVREIVAADADTEVQISDEQLDRLADRVVAAVPPHVAEAVRAAFARAGQAGA